MFSLAISFWSKITHSIFATLSEKIAHYALICYSLWLGTEHWTNRAEWVVPVTQIERPSANTAIFVRESGKWPSTMTDLNTVVSFAQDNNADDRRIQRYHLSQTPSGRSARYSRTRQNKTTSTWGWENLVSRLEAFCNNPSLNDLL